MLQKTSSVFIVYRRKTLTGSPDPTHANGTDKPCTIVSYLPVAILDIIDYFGHVLRHILVYEILLKSPQPSTMLFSVERV